MLKRKTESVRYALRGIRIAFSEEMNFQIELVIGAFAFLLGALLRISGTEWLFIIGVSGIVLSAEILNTALEELCDMLRDTHDPHVAKIKDLGAGAVLIASFAAFAVGVLIFLPKLLAFL